jgi:hypothetical protein
MALSLAPAPVPNVTSNDQMNKYQIDIGKIKAWPGRVDDLPAGVNPLPMHPCDMERLCTETEIYLCKSSLLYPWAREGFFLRRSSATKYGRKLVAFSEDFRGRIVRGWFLTESDQAYSQTTYALYGGCPAEAAWLASIAPGVPSEPAVIYTGHPKFS